MVRVVTLFSCAAREMDAPCRISFRARRERSRAEKLRLGSFEARTMRVLFDLEDVFRAGAVGRIREIASRWRLRDLDLFFISLPTLT